jgi:hypothetical protein
MAALVKAGSMASVDPEAFLLRLRDAISDPIKHIPARSRRR